MVDSLGPPLSPQEKFALGSPNLRSPTGSSSTTDALRDVEKADISILHAWASSSPYAARPLDRSLLQPGSSSTAPPSHIQSAPLFPCPPGGGDDGGGAPMPVDRSCCTTQPVSSKINESNAIASPSQILSRALSAQVRSLKGHLSPGADSYFQEDHMLRAEARACVMELFERERTTWAGHIRELQNQRNELDREIDAVLAEGAGEDLTSHTAEHTVSGFKTVASSRASAMECQIEAQSLEREEALLEAVARERLNNSSFHANDARNQELRAESLEASASDEAAARHKLSLQLSALEARAAQEERRRSHEHKIKSVQAQVAEAATIEAEKNSEEVTREYLLEEEASQEKHNLAMRRFTKTASKRLALLEEEWADRLRRISEEAAVVEASPEQQVESMLSSLKHQRAEESAQHTIAREEVELEIHEMSLDFRNAARGRAQCEAAMARVNDQVRSATDASTVARSASGFVSRRLAATQERLEECKEEASLRLADAEMRAARQHYRNNILTGQSQLIEKSAKIFRGEYAATKNAFAIRIADLEQELALARSDADSKTRVAHDRFLAETANKELARVEQDHATVAAKLAAQSAQEINAARARQECAQKKLSRLRQALAQEHALAEASHFEAIEREEAAQQTLLMLEFESSVDASRKKNAHHV